MGTTMANETAESLARKTFIITLIGAFVAMAVAFFWVIW